MAFFSHRLALLAAAITLGIASGCASPTASAPGATAFSFFAEPRPQTDPWFEKVREWQARERADRKFTSFGEPEDLRAGRQSGQLRIKMGRWENAERLAMARRVADWAQGESRRHYRFDPPTDAASDPWPTTKDLLRTNSDDCDGLDLIAYELLRQFGFPREQLFRAIVRRDRDGGNHMVTLWFDESEDPWVIDAIGAMTLKVRRFSELPGWTPTAVFNEQQQFTPQRLRKRSVARIDAAR
ncbi:MAG: hypothetical protein VX546_06400 [Myxococcota bacterium]|nr:hypothetical protein [Myxococcota bacterium]